MHIHVALLKTNQQTSEGMLNDYACKELTHIRIACLYGTYANSVDPNQTSQNAASDQGNRCAASDQGLQCILTDCSFRI